MRSRIVPIFICFTSSDYYSISHIYRNNNFISTISRYSTLPYYNIWIKIYIVMSTRVYIITIILPFHIITYFFYNSFSIISSISSKITNICYIIIHKISSEYSHLIWNTRITYFMSFIHIMGSDFYP